MQLAAAETEFNALGIKLVVMTYDSHKDALEFTRKHKIKFPILQDVNRHHVNQFGILNKQYPPGHWAYGVPHPGMFLVDARGKIYARFSEAGYKKRPAIKLVLEAARQMQSAQ